MTEAREPPPPPPPVALATGSVVASRYEILGLVGEGGMGVVYRARDRSLDEVIAIKALRPHLVGSPGMTQRFRAEIKLARRVTHRNVCRIHDYGEDGALAFISMEFVEGVDLKRLVRDSATSRTTRCSTIAQQLADGLQAIHDVGIIHRDFKTANVMIDRRGTVRLMDFGIAKLWEAETADGLTLQGQTAGTPEYMSPEQAPGRVARSAQRHLFAGHRAVRAVHGDPAVCRGARRGGDLQAAPRGAAVERPACGGASGGASGGHAKGARQVARRAVRVGERAPASARGVAWRQHDDL